MSSRASDARAAQFAANPEHPRHGTEHGYVYWRCKCDRCMGAWRLANAARRQRALERRIMRAPSDDELRAAFLPDEPGPLLDKLRSVWRAAQLASLNNTDTKEGPTWPAN